MNPDMLTLQERHPTIMLALGEILERAATNNSICQDVTCVAEVAQHLDQIETDTLTVAQKAALKIAKTVLLDIFVLPNEKPFPLFETDQIKRSLPYNGDYEYVYRDPDVSDNKQSVIAFTETETGVYFSATKAGMFDQKISIGLCGKFETEMSLDALARVNFGRDENQMEFMLESFGNGLVTFEDLDLNSNLPEYTNIYSPTRAFLEESRETIANAIFSSCVAVNTNECSYVTRSNSVEFLSGLQSKCELKVEFESNTLFVTS